MAIHSNAGTKQYISPTPVNPDTINAMSDGDAITFFQSINDWIEIEEVEDHGTFGDASEAINFTAVGNKRVRKLKGPKDAGTQSVVVGRDPLDDGQEALIVAEATDFNYAHRVVFNDARSPNHSKSELFFAGMVMSKANNAGNVSNVVRRNFDIGINTAVYELLSDSLSAPVNALLPSIAGVLDEAEVLTALVGTWSNDPTGFTYQWKRDGTNISGATGKTYTVVAGDVGKAISVAVTATNGAGNATATSAATANIPS